MYHRGFSIGAIIPLLYFISNTQSLGDHSSLHLFQIFLDLVAARPISNNNYYICISANGWDDEIDCGKIFSFLMFDIGKEISEKVLDNSLQEPLEKQIVRNSSELVSLSTQKVLLVVHGAVGPTFNFITATMLLLSIITILFVVNFSVSVIGVSIFVTLYVLISIAFKEKLR